MMCLGLLMWVMCCVSWMCSCCFCLCKGCFILVLGLLCVICFCWNYLYCWVFLINCVVCKIFEFCLKFFNFFVVMGLGLICLMLYIFWGFEKVRFWIICCKWWNYVGGRMDELVFSSWISGWCKLRNGYLFICDIIRSSERREGVVEIWCGEYNLE